MVRRILPGMITSSLLLAVTSVSHAQNAPSSGLMTKPVRIVVPGPPGGPAGNVATFLTPKFAQKIGQVAIVEYRPGAQGNIAMEYVSKSAPDGYTLMFAAPLIVTNPHFFKNAVEPSAVEPIVMLVHAPYMMLVNMKSGLNSVPEAIAKIRSAPGDIKCAIGVPLSTASCYLLQDGSGPINMVAYPGNAQAVAAVERGEIDILFDFMNTAGAAAREGRVRPLGVTSVDRVPGEFKDLPPMADFVSGFELIGWQGIVAPRGMSEEIVAKYNKAFNDVLAEEDVRKFFANGSLQISGGAPDVLGKRIERDFKFYGRIAKEAKIQPE
ncbi:MAG: Bug family tripartite tricarboxylate transporter substrate binding protein [Xanthobacteraceae bacterium]